VNVELIHKIRTAVNSDGNPIAFIDGAITGEIVPDGDRFNVVNKDGNLLIKGATEGFLNLLREKKMLQDVNQETLEEMYNRIFKPVDSSAKE